MKESANFIARSVSVSAYLGRMESHNLRNDTVRPGIGPTMGEASPNELKPLRAVLESFKFAFFFASNQSWSVQRPR
jgi:hypothetical protein